MANVLLIHGYGGDVTDMFILGNFLRNVGHSTRFFGYQFSPTEKNLSDEFLEDVAIHGPSVVIGYSLGGLILMKHIGALGKKTVRKAICLGSPLAGFGSGYGILGFPLSEAVQKLLAEPILIPARGNVKVGSIAGTYNFALLGFPASRPGDGIVLEKETIIPRLTASVSVNEGHTGLPYSPKVAEHIAHFIEHDRFLH